MRYKKAAPDLLVASPEDSYDVLVSLDSLFTYEYRYLCDDTKIFHLSALSDHSELSMIRQLGFDDQLSEAIMKYGGISNHMNPSKLMIRNGNRL